MRLLSIILLMIFSYESKGQILISLLLGDKLNSEKLEFGIDGGLNFSTIQGSADGALLRGFNLGFYFDIKTKSKWEMHTGLYGVSPMGISSLNPYLLNNPNLDNSFINGEVKRKLNYISPFFMMKRKLFSNFYAEGGIQGNLLIKAYDQFTNEKKDLVYKKNITSDLNRIDFGPTLSLGYRLLKGRGMKISARYYYGLQNLQKDQDLKKMFNRSFYLGVGVPVGSKKKID